MRRRQRIEALSGARRDLKRARECVRESPPPELIEDVDLVQHELERDVVRADLRQERLDRLDRLPNRSSRKRGVRDVEHEVRDECLLERRGESLDQLGRRRRMNPTVSVTR